MKEFVKKHKKNIATGCLIAFAFIIGHYRGVRDTEFKLIREISNFFKAAEIIEF